MGSSAASTTGRPAPGGAAAESMNILVMGTDRRSGRADHGRCRHGRRVGAGRAAHGHDHAPAHQREPRRLPRSISIPRDSWVNIPGHGHNKVNAAFSLRGTLTGDRDRREAHRSPDRPSRRGRLGGIPLPHRHRRRGRPSPCRGPSRTRTTTSCGPRAGSTLNGAQALTLLAPALRAPDRRHRPGEAAAGDPALADAGLDVDPRLRQPDRDLRPARHAHARTSPSTPTGSSGTCAACSWTCAA